MSKKKISPEAQAIVSAVDAGYYATTVKLAEQFLETNPNSQRAWLDLGQALAQLGRYEQAETAFQKVIDLDDGVPAEVLGEIGNLYRSKGDFESAMGWYKKQIAASPDDSIGHLYLGNIRMRQGEFDEAVSIFESALECKQLCLEEIHYSIGLAYRGKGDFNLAKEHFEKALTYDSQFADAKVALKDVKPLIE